MGLLIVMIIFVVCLVVLICIALCSGPTITIGGGEKGFDISTMEVRRSDGIGDSQIGPKVRRWDEEGTEGMVECEKCNGVGMRCYGEGVVAMCSDCAGTGGMPKGMADCLKEYKKKYGEDSGLL